MGISIGKITLTAIAAIVIFASVSVLIYILLPIVQEDSK